MKKSICIAAILLLLASLCACGLSEEEVSEEELRERTIDHLNQNSDLPFPLALPEKELEDIDAYQRFEGFGCWGLENADATITISSYPDCLDAYHVTDIHLLTAKYSILGLRVGEPIKEAVDWLKSEGYVRAPDSWRWGGIHYTKDSVVVCLEYNDTEDSQPTVSALTVYALITNVKNVDFDY